MEKTIETALLEKFLPGYDWDRFEIAGYEMTNNEDENSNRFYSERMMITIQEKNTVPPDMTSRQILCSLISVTQNLS